MRPIIVHLTVAALLACPFDCATRLAAANLSSGASQACCARCRQKADHPPAPARDERSPVERGPAQPAPSEDGIDCLCEGAVFDLTAKMPADLRAATDWWAADSDHALFAARRPAGQLVAPAAREMGGSFARILLCALLL